MGAARPPAGRLLTLCIFYSAVFLAGLGAVALVKRGTAFLEERHGQATAGTTQVLERQRLLGTGPGKRVAAGAAGLGLRREDLVVAIPTDKGHEDYVAFSRVWRQGIRTYVATNHSLEPAAARQLLAEHNETWASYPDDQPLHTLALKGDSRAALAPFLAFRELGDSFKWLLYGDDDTYFFTDAVLQTVAGLDADMPYFLTDHHWWTEKWTDGDGAPHEHTQHPSRAVPLCVPCGYAKNASGLPFPPPRGCPCTPVALCDADTKGVFFRGLGGQCGMPRVPIRTYSMHGGAGALISVGLLRAIPWQRFEDCVTSTYTTGGDALISICLWQSGFYMTAPDPLWHPQGLYMFDVGELAQADHEPIQGRVARLMGNLLQAAAGSCGQDPCKLELSGFLTLHMRSRKFPSRAAHAEVSRLLAALADFAYGRADSLVPESSAAPGKVSTSRILDAQVLTALAAFRQQRLCQTGGSAAEGNCTELQGVAARPGRKSRFPPLQQQDTNEAARELAAAIVNDVFDRFPSPTGSYGDIPVGRE